MVHTCRWDFGEGESIDFTINEIDSLWRNEPGLYMFSYQMEDGSWNTLYIGETDSFRHCFEKNKLLAEAQQLGATHIQTNVMHSKAERKMFKRLILSIMRPSMNAYEEFHTRDNHKSLIG